MQPKYDLLNYYVAVAWWERHIPEEPMLEATDTSGKTATYPGLGFTVLVVSSKRK
jgi:hypothetical protein